MGLPQQRGRQGRCYRAFAVLLLLVGLFSPGSAQDRVTLTISAAASLKDAIAEAEAAVGELDENERRSRTDFTGRTIVTIDGKLLGKPTGRDDARRMLESLSGRGHYVGN